MAANVAAMGQFRPDFQGREIYNLNRKNNKLYMNNKGGECYGCGGGGGPSLNTPLL